MNKLEDAMSKAEDYQFKLMKAESLLAQRDQEIGELWQKFADKIESIVAEFGDDPKACLSIIGEHLNGRTTEER